MEDTPIMAIRKIVNNFLSFALFVTWMSCTAFGQSTNSIALNSDGEVPVSERGSRPTANLDLARILDSVESETSQLDENGTGNADGQRTLANTGEGLGPSGTSPSANGSDTNAILAAILQSVREQNERAEAVTAIDDSGLSTEQDFDAVTYRLSIQSDAERLRAQKENRTEFEPVDLPERLGRKNVADFAIETTHNVGLKIYPRRSLFVTEAGVRKRCSEFPDSYSAQQAFLDLGGPDVDSMKIDPDGDGFVCGWNPNSLRQLLR